MGDLQPSATVGDGNWLYKAVEVGDLEQIRSQFASLGSMKQRVQILNSKNESNDDELPSHCAARHGYLEILQLLLSDSDLPLFITDARTKTKGWSCLHFAAAYGHAEIVRWLLNSGKADAALPDNEGNIPLHLAICSGRTNVVTYLVPEAATLFTLNKNNMVPLSLCKDHPSMFEALITAVNVDNVSIADPSNIVAQVSFLHTKDAENRTILHHAAQFAKDPDVIANLINDNPEILQHRDSQGYTFLHAAAKCGNLEVLQALKKLGSNRLDVTQLFSGSESDPLIHSPGMYALLHNDMQFFNELITVGTVKITLSCIIKGLISELIDTSEIQERLALFVSTLPTYLALYANKECIFNFLLDTKLLNISQWDDEYKRTCLHWAVLDKRTDIVEKLCRNDQLRPGIQDRDGKTALHHAFEQKNHMVMEILRGKDCFKEHEEKLFRDRDVYVQALNAILVGAALIASVTFAGWLQIPSGTDFVDSIYMRIFWASNSTSFFTAVATMCVTTTALLPTPNNYVGDIVNQVRLAIVIDAGLLAFSLVAVTGAFAAAGFAALQQAAERSTYKTIMWSTAVAGGLLCLIMLIAFMVQLYRCTPSKRMLFALVLPFLPNCGSCWTPWLPASIRNIRARIGESSRNGYPVKLKSELKGFMTTLDLVAAHQQQLALRPPAHASNFIPIETMKQKLRNLDIPDIDEFLDKIYEQKQEQASHS